MDDHAPPSMNRWSPMRTGWYQPGMAQDAITAVDSSTSGTPGAPNGTRAPVS